VTDQWEMLGRYLDSLERELIPAAKINKGDRAKALSLMSTLQREYAQRSAFLEGVNAATGSVSAALPAVEHGALLRTVEDQKLKFWADLLGRSATIFEICERGRTRRPLGSKKSEGADIMLGFRAWVLTRSGLLETQALRQAVTEGLDRDELGKHTTIAGHMQRVRRTLKTFRPAYERLLEEAAAEDRYKNSAQI
jgi:hypothetical protein